jgi:pyruvate dehydrogenase E2 component (dihydrolipoamide acetyltransferase)
MALEFKLPDIGEGIAEGEITTWLVNEGDQVSEDQPMVEVMTDKATVEITSPRSGTILKLLVEEGTTVDIGTRIIVIGDPGEEVADIESEVSAPPAEASDAPSDVTEPAAATSASATVAAARSGSGGGSPTLGAEAGARPGGKALATPSVRRQAREMGIDIDSLIGSGPAGRILAEDLQAARAGAAGGARPAAARPAAASGGDERFKLKGVRKLIAERLSESVQKAVHVTHVDEIEMTAMNDFLEKAVARAEEEGVRLTYLPFIAKALIETLKEFPMFNAFLDEEAAEIVHRRDYHIGVAVATDRGLLVPVVRHADQLGVLELAQQIRDRAAATRDGSIGPDDLSGSTISITNFGAIGGLFATPIINYPEAAILGIGTSKPRPVVRNGEIVIRHMMYASITFDHRITDGAEGARFMNTFKDYLENPALIFMEW